MFDINSLPKTFLGANAAGGFCSKFAECYYPDEDWRAYIIKGGPGTGKSTMMKQIAACLSDKGCRVELCPCSSDPDSLDAVIIHDKKTVIMDGTSPHTVDPAYPGVCETIINLSDCWNRSEFLGKEKEILALTRQNKQHHARASRYISAAASLLSDNKNIVRSHIDLKKLTEYTERLTKRLIPKGEGFKEHTRFLSGVTPRGVIFYKATLNKMCDTIIAISDDFGVVSDEFMKIIKAKAREQKREIYVCRNSLLPDYLDHIIFPDLRLCFCSENRLCHPEGITRRIHARRFTDMVSLGGKRNRLQFNQQSAEELLREAVSVIAEAKSVHDELEAFYIDAMDFSLVGKLTEKIALEIEKR